MNASTFPFTSVRMVQTYKPLEVAVQWQLDAAFRDVGPFMFTVQVTETPDFSELLYTLPAGENFYVVDDRKLRQGAVTDFYYRVKLETGSQHTYTSPAIGHWANGATKHLFLTAREITRREFVRYRFTGQVGWVLKRRNYGIQDPTQLDPITGVPLTDQSTDFGTGFVGGYYTPLRVTYSREAVENTAQLSEQGFGTTCQESQKHRYVGFPVLEPNDILVTDTNQRYRYVKAAATFMPGTDMLLLQSCDCILLPPTDPIYKIEIPKSHE